MVRFDDLRACEEARSAIVAEIKEQNQFMDPFVKCFPTSTKRWTMNFSDVQALIMFDLSAFIGALAAGIVILTVVNRFGR
jgi:hypothetical protein